MSRTRFLKHGFLLLICYAIFSLFHNAITRLYQAPDFENFNNTIGSENGEYIVPDYVHFIRLGVNNMTFIDAVCILAALKHQHPDVLFIHTDQIRFDQTWGKYWSVVKRDPLATTIKVKIRNRPKEIFGQRISSEHWINGHLSEVARLQVLSEYGGIYLDNDAYVVRNFDDLRRFEMSLGWQELGTISNHAIVAHKEARFLKKWLNDSILSYDYSEWLYKAEAFLQSKSNWNLIKRVKTSFAEEIGCAPMIYLENSGVWRKHYVIYLQIQEHAFLLGHRNLTSEATYPVIFDEHNILKYDANIKYMALDVYPFNRSKVYPSPEYSFHAPLDFEKFNSSISKGDDEYIVPNYVHFIRFGAKKMTFIDAVCILAALKHQHPDVLFIHTDQLEFDQIWGKYWSVVKRVPHATLFKVMIRNRPKEIFGQRISSEHWINGLPSEVARLQVLSEYGGIYLDNDAYAVRNFDKLRKFEMSLGWQDVGPLSNHAIVAHKEARFLKMWLNDSIFSYDYSEWLYNAEAFLKSKSNLNLVKRVKRLFAEEVGTAPMIYLEISGSWRHHYVIYLQIQEHAFFLGHRNLTSEATYPVIFDERNILKYDANIKYMALDVYPFERNKIYPNEE